MPAVLSRLSSSRYQGTMLSAFWWLHGMIVSKSATDCFLNSRPDFDLDNFFKYENQKEPPSLSDQGKLRSGTKSDVLQCLTIPKLTPSDDVTVKVLDGPAVVHMVRPTYGTNYQQDVVRHFMPFITNSLTTSTSRLDIIWDIYPDHNLKA